MKFAQSLLLFVLLAFTVQVIDAKKCKAKSTSSSSSGNTHKATAKATHEDASSSSSSSSTKSTKSKSSSSSSSSSTSTSSVSVSGMTPNGIKAGVSGGQSVKFLGSSIGSWNDWGAAGGDDHTDSSAMYVPMLWGNGDDSANTGLSSQSNSKRLADFKKLPVGKYKYLMGFNEFDFHGTGSSGQMQVSAAASLWDELMTKHKNAGSALISPSCAKQADETMLRPFLDAVKTKPDCIAIHIFQDSMEGVKKVWNHYETKYSEYKCFWITEFAYANYQNGAHNFGSVGSTDALVKEAVQFFENESKIKAYFLSDADNGNNGNLTPDHSGSSLSSLGNTYLSTIKSYTSRKRSEGNHANRHVRRAAAASRRSAQTPN